MVFLDRWLQTIPRRPARHLTVEDVVAGEDVDEESVRAFLGHELRRNYVLPGELAVILHGLGAERLAQHLRENKLPSKSDRQ